MLAKIRTTFLTILCIFMLCTTAFAGDIPESIITNDSTDVVIGTITAIDSEKTTLEVSEFMFQTMELDVLVLDNFKYMVNNADYENPKVGDYCAIAITTEGEADGEVGEIKLYYNLCAKANSLDTETLKLESLAAFVERMNGYINDGTYSKEHREQLKRKVYISSAKPVTEPASTQPAVQTVVTPLELDVATTKTNSNNYTKITSALAVVVLVAVAFKIKPHKKRS